MDENMNKDDFMNDLYDYLWMPEDEQGALYLHQNILFGRAADEEKIACATLPYLFRLGITPQMRGYVISPQIICDLIRQGRIRAVCSNNPPLCIQHKNTVYPQGLQIPFQELPA